MREPGGEPVTRIVPHRALFGGDAESIGNPLCRPLVIGRENNADVAVIENRIMLAIGFIDLIERLRDQIDPDSVARHEGSTPLEAFATPQGDDPVAPHHKLTFWTRKTTSREKVRTYG